MSDTADVLGLGDVEITNSDIREYDNDHIVLDIQCSSHGEQISKEVILYTDNHAIGERNVIICSYLALISVVMLIILLFANIHYLRKYTK